MAEPYLGEIRLFSGNFAPVDWALCDGTMMKLSENTALFALIGTSYGGDGMNTFALPDLRGRVGIHQGSISGTGTNYVLGQQAGTENVTLLTSQLPVHTHEVEADSNVGGVNDPANAFWAGSTINQYANTQPVTEMSADAILSSGGNQPHNNMMPSLTVSYIIALQGIFPSRD